MKNYRSLQCIKVGTEGMITTRNTDVANSSGTVVTLYILVYLGGLLLCSFKMKTVNSLKTPGVSPDFPNRLCCW